MIIVYARWMMVIPFYFSGICGWKVWLWKIGSIAFFSFLLITGWLRRLKWSTFGLVRVERLGSGVDLYKCGRRSSWGSVVLVELYYFAGWCYWQVAVESSHFNKLLAVLIIFFNKLLLNLSMKMSSMFFGTKISLSNSSFLCGVFFSTAYQQTTIW